MAHIFSDTTNVTVHEVVDMVDYVGGLKDTQQMLKAYLQGQKSLSDCAEWVAGIDWDRPELTSEDKQRLGLLELLLTEAVEGLRPEKEFEDEASSIIKLTGRRNES